MTAAEAADRLGVKTATLYAYVSRGVLSRRRSPKGHSVFSVDEIERLARRGRPRRGATAADPHNELLIESRVTALGVDRPYYHVPGTLKGAWEGIDAGVVVLNWSDKLESFAWFAGRGHRQVIAGYYDGEEPRLETWLPAVRARLRGQRQSELAGVMYTTWMAGYSQLEPFARTGWGRR